MACGHTCVQSERNETVSGEERRGEEREREKKGKREKESERKPYQCVLHYQHKFMGNLLQCSCPVSA